MSPPLGIGIGIDPVLVQSGKQVASASGPIYAQVVSDSFNRADNSVALGTADTGQIWTNDTNGWKILTNRAQSKVGATNTASLDTTLTNMRVEAKAIAFGSDSLAILGRMTNTTNFVRLFFNATSFVLSHVIAGGTTVLATQAVTLVSGQTVAFDIQGFAVRGYLDGVLILSGTTTVATGTRAGLSNADVGDIVDDFKVYSIT